jgi:hypothetical protein
MIRDARADAGPYNPRMVSIAPRSALMVVLACACGEPTPAPEPTETVVVAPIPTPPSVPTPPVEGLEGLETPPTEDEVAPVTTLSTEVPAGAHTCARLSEPRVVLEHAGRTAIAAGYLGQVFVAAYLRDASGEAVAVARVADGRAPELVTRIPLPTPVAETARGARPGLAMLGSSVLLLAVTDGTGALLYAELDAATGAVAGGFDARIEDAHADSRFAPAITSVADGTRVVAWTDGSGTPMHVRAARLSASGAVLSDAVISPDGGGAAPVVGRGESAPALYFVEARIAMSAAHRVALGPDGTPAPSEVARPLLRGSDSPAIAVVRAPAGSRSHLAYAAVGNLATRAIGLVQTTGTDSPLPLVPGLGYGNALSLAAVPLERSAVFAMEAPSAALPAAPHEVRVRVASDDGTLGEPLVLPSETAPDVAVLSHDEHGYVLAVGTQGARVTFVRCSE